MTTRLFVLLLVVLIPAGSSACAHRAITLEDPAPGALLVVERSIELHDEERDKALPVVLRFPEAPGTYPIIVMSHGLGGNGDLFAMHAEYWASYGYVVACPTHIDSLRNRDVGRRIGRNGAIADPAVWSDRARDVSFILDQFERGGVARHAPGISGKADTERVGVAGHSYGAHTCQTLGGIAIYDTETGARLPLRDDRVDAVMPISAQGLGPDDNRGLGLRADSWESRAVPIMYFGGSRDRARLGKPPSWRAEPFERCDPGDAYLVWIEGATHGSYQGSRIDRKTGKEIIAAVQHASLPFWDLYLKGDERAREQLTNDAIARKTNGRAELRAK